MDALAQALRFWPLVADFELYVVGSFVELGSKANDIDIVVRTREGGSPDYRDIEKVLIGIEYFGLKRLNVAIDTTFRELSETEMAARAMDGQPFPSIKLYAPRWRALAKSSPEAVRQVSRYLVEIWRTVDQTSYFGKLPQVEQGGRRYRRYREAMPLFEFRRH